MEGAGKDMAKKRRRNSGAAVLSLLVLVAVCAAGFFVYRTAVNDINGKNQKSTEYNLYISESDYDYTVGRALANNKIVFNDALWTNWMTKHYPDFEFIPGEYLVSAKMTYDELAEKLKNPDVTHRAVKLVVPEGFSVFDIAKRLEKNNVCSAESFLEVCKSTEGFDFEWLSAVPDSGLVAYKLEGFLFPATYDLEENTDARDVAEEMLEAFDYRLSDDMTSFAEANNMSLYEFLTLVSIVQEEAIDNDSAGKTASVFFNRLASGMKLQSDVTVFYARALQEEGGFSDRVYDAYSTYRCKALPAGPICNSGKDVIDSVINHPDTDYYYFFSDLKKQFHYAKDYDEFEQQKQKYPWKE